MLGSRQRPPHLVRWWTHIASIHTDLAYEKLWRKAKKPDLRLLKALRSKDFVGVRRFMDLVDLSTKFPNRRASQALHYACRMEQPDLVIEFLNRGADINARDGEGMTPLLFAVMKSNDEIIDLLLERGAEANSIDNQGRSAFYIAANVERLDLLDRFIKLGCDPNSTTKRGRTALTKTAWNGQVEVVRCLLSIPQVSVNIKDLNGRTPLHASVWGNSGGRDSKKKYGLISCDSPECAELLIRYGASIEAIDLKENTPLLTAAKTNAVASIRKLLGFEANLKHVNKKGRNALYFAIKYGFLECASVLIEAGLNINEGRTVWDTPLIGSIVAQQLNSAKFLVDKPNLILAQEHIKACINYGSYEILQLLIDRFQGEFIEQQLIDDALDGERWKTAAVLTKYCKITHDHLLKSGKNAELLDILLGFYTESIDRSVVCKLVDLGSCTEKLMKKAQISIDLVKAVIHRDLIHLLEPMFTADIDWATIIDTEDLTTPLHLLASKGETLVAQQLLLACSDVQHYIKLCNSDGMTAIDIARMHNHNSFADFLESFLMDFSSPFKVIKPVYEDVPDGFSLHPVPAPVHHSYPVLHFKSSPIIDPYILVNTQDALTNLRKEIRSVQLIGLDLECHLIDQTRKYIALIQITVNGTDYIVDALTNRELLGEIMQEVMVSPSIVKVMHGCDTDMVLLQTDFQAFSLNVFDTARAHSNLNSKNNLPSYASLVKEMFGIAVDKSYQISDWRIRPLPKPMLDYARTDSHYLPELYSMLRNSMSDKMLDNLLRQVSKHTHKTPSSRHNRIKLYEPSY